MTASTAYKQKRRVVLGLLTFGPPGSEPYGYRIPSLEKFGECLDYFQGQGYGEIDTGTYQRSASQSPSLVELGCETVDIFYLHAPDRSVPFEETLDACNELHHAGKFKELGLSNYAAWEVAEIWNIANERGWVNPTVYQAMYNAFTRAIEDEWIPYCRKYGISIVGHNPLAGGMLSGKYKTNEVPTEGRDSDIDTNVGKMYRERYFREANFDALSRLEPVAQKEGLSLPEITFRWYVQHSKMNMVSNNDGIVIGISSIDQLKANVVPYLTENMTRASRPLYWR